MLVLIFAPLPLLPLVLRGLFRLLELLALNGEVLLPPLFDTTCDAVAAVVGDEIDS